MNKLFLNWIRENKGVTEEDLQKKSDKEFSELWQEYCKSRGEANEEI